MHLMVSSQRRPAKFRKSFPMFGRPKPICSRTGKLTFRCPFFPGPVLESQVLTKSTASGGFCPSSEWSHLLTRLEAAKEPLTMCGSEFLQCG